MRGYSNGSCQGTLDRTPWMKDYGYQVGGNARFFKTYFSRPDGSLIDWDLEICRNVTCSEDQTTLHFNVDGKLQKCTEGEEIVLSDKIWGWVYQKLKCEDVKGYCRSLGGY